MKKLTLEQITALQKQYGYAEMQEMINSGLCWKLEGSVGRSASAELECGSCMLPEQVRVDSYGNRVPSRNDLKDGSKGTFTNSQEFWQKVEDGETFLEYVDEEIDE